MCHKKFIHMNTLKYLLNKYVNFIHNDCNRNWKNWILNRVCWENCTGILAREILRFVIHMAHALGDILSDNFFGGLLGIFEDWFWCDLIDFYCFVLFERHIEPKALKLEAHNSQNKSNPSKSLKNFPNRSPNNYSLNRTNLMLTRNRKWYFVFL